MSITFTFVDGSTQTIGPETSGLPDQSIAFASDEQVTSFSILSSQSYVTPGHLGFPYFGGFIIGTTAQSPVTFAPGFTTASPSGPALADYTTTALQFNSGSSDAANIEYLGGGFMCGMYGWTMGSWEVMTSIDTAVDVYGSQDNSFVTDLQRSYGLKDLDNMYYGASW